MTGVRPKHSVDLPRGKQGRVSLSIKLRHDEHGARHDGRAAFRVRFGAARELLQLAPHFFVQLGRQDVPVVLGAQLPLQCRRHVSAGCRRPSSLNFRA